MMHIAGGFKDNTAFEKTNKPRSFIYWGTENILLGNVETTNTIVNNYNIGLFPTAFKALVLKKRT